MTLRIDGHDVADAREGMVAVISHYIRPAVGHIRLDDSRGVTDPTRHLTPAINRAVDALIAAGYTITAPETDSSQS